jgi:hypothetical protein
MRILFKVSLLLIIVGAFLFGAFYIINGGYTPGVGDSDVELIEISYDAIDFDEIRVVMINKSIQVLPSTSDKIELKYYQSEKNWIEISTEGNILDIENKTEIFHMFFNWFSWFQNQAFHQFILYLPLDMIFDLDLSTSNGAIDISDLSELGTLRLRSSNGAIVLGEITLINSIDAYTSNGLVEFNQLIVQNLAKARTSNGKIIVEKTTVGELDVQTSNGAVNVELHGTHSMYRIDMATSNGSKTLNGVKTDASIVNPSASLDVRVRTSNGPISIRFTLD